MQVEVGDVILKVNETDVNRFSTKEGNYEFIVRKKWQNIIEKFGIDFKVQPEIPYIYI